jgi:hypothetical protein
MVEVLELATSKRKHKGNEERKTEGKQKLTDLSSDFHPHCPE